MQNSEGDTSEFKSKIVQCFNKSDITVRRAAINCIQSVVTLDNVREIIGDLMKNIDELEFGVLDENLVKKDKEADLTEKPKDEKQLKAEPKQAKQESDHDDEKLEDDEENIDEKKKVKLSFSDSDRSYRDLMIKTVLRILVSDDYKNVNGDFQWCINIMLQLGMYKGDRVDRLIAESIRHLFIKMEDEHRKNGANSLINTFMNTISIKKNAVVINYSYELIDVLLFLLAENSYAVGAVKAPQILEYLRKHMLTFEKTLEITKSSLCEVIFRLSLIELNNNINKNREIDIIQDRLKLFKDLIMVDDNKH